MHTKDHRIRDRLPLVTLSEVPPPTSDHIDDQFRFEAYVFVLQATLGTGHPRPDLVLSTDFTEINHELQSPFYRDPRKGYWIGQSNNKVDYPHLLQLRMHAWRVALRFLCRDSPNLEGSLDGAPFPSRNNDLIKSWVKTDPLKWNKGGRNFVNIGDFTKNFCVLRIRGHTDIFQGNPVITVTEPAMLVTYWKELKFYPREITEFMIRLYRNLPPYLWQANRVKHLPVQLRPETIGKLLPVPPPPPLPAPSASPPSPPRRAVRIGAIEYLNEYAEVAHFDGGGFDKDINLSDSDGWPDRTDSDEWPESIIEAPAVHVSEASLREWQDLSDDDVQEIPDPTPSQHIVDSVTDLRISGEINVAKVVILGFVNTMSISCGESAAVIRGEYKAAKPVIRDVQIRVADVSAVVPGVRSLDSRRVVTITVTSDKIPSLMGVADENEVIAEASEFDSHFFRTWSLSQHWTVKLRRSLLDKKIPTWEVISMEPCD